MLELKNIEALILDWSGTIVDDLATVWDATNYCFEKFGVAPISRETFREEFCLPFLPFYRRYLPTQSLEEIDDYYFERFNTIQDEVVLLPHAREFLEFARNHGLRMFVLSTMDPVVFERLCGRLGINHFYEGAYVGIMDKMAEIHRVIQSNNLDPESALYVGDMVHDIETARHGGVKSCVVLTGFDKLEKLRPAGPDLIVEHLGELQQMFERSLGPRAPQAERRQPIVTVGALIFNARGECLMVRTPKWNRSWGIPGGKVRYGEPMEAALAREMKEETGLDVRDIRFVMAQDCIESAEFYRREHFLLLNFTCRADATVVQLNEELEDFRWISTEDALKLELNKPTRILIETYARITRS
ncbi:MAG: NUDIX domain-containing protein [Verrucomicrobia bacterium]|nr:NUDIX domain-containing protein [Verrucomicrobiota bacterium]